MGKNSDNFSTLSVTQSIAFGSPSRTVAVYKGLKVTVYTVDKTELSLTRTDLIELINVRIWVIDLFIFRVALFCRCLIYESSNSKIKLSVNEYLLPSPSLSERTSVRLSRCVCVRRISLDGEGNALYPVLSSANTSRLLVPPVRLSTVSVVGLSPSLVPASGICFRKRLYVSSVTVDIPPASQDFPLHEVLSWCHILNSNTADY